MENIVRPRVVLTQEEMAQLQDLLDAEHRLRLYGDCWGVVGEARHLAQTMVALTMVVGDPAETLLLACAVRGATPLGDMGIYFFPGLEVL